MFSPPSILQDPPALNPLGNYPSAVLSCNNRVISQSISLNILNQTILDVLYLLLSNCHFGMGT